MACRSAIVVDVPKSDIPQAYWYMTYNVTNLGDKEVMFLPRFELLTESGQLVRSDVNIPKERVRRHQNEGTQPAARAGDVDHRPACAWAKPKSRDGRGHLPRTHAADGPFFHLRHRFERVKR